MIITVKWNNAEGDGYQKVTIPDQSDYAVSVGGRLVESKRYIGGEHVTERDNPRNVSVQQNTQQVATNNKIGGNLHQTTVNQSGGINMSNARIGRIGNVSDGDVVAGRRINGDKVQLTTTSNDGTVQQSSVSVTGGNVRGIVTGFNAGNIHFSASDWPDDDD